MITISIIQGRLIKIEEETRRIHPNDFQACFMEWTNWEVIKTAGEIVAIDGKTLRRWMVTTDE